MYAAVWHTPLLPDKVVPACDTQGCITTRLHQQEPASVPGKFTGTVTALNPGATDATHTTPMYCLPAAESSRQVLLDQSRPPGMHTAWMPAHTVMYTEAIRAHKRVPPVLTHRKAQQGAEKASQAVCSPRSRRVAVLLSYLFNRPGLCRE